MKDYDQNWFSYFEFFDIIEVFKKQSPYPINS